MRTNTVTGELDSISRMICEKYPDRNAGEIDTLVGDVHRRLSSAATVTAHLIPLTVNRCHKVLKAPRHSVDEVFETVGPMTIAS